MTGRSVRLLGLLGSRDGFVSSLIVVCRYEYGNRRSSFLTVEDAYIWDRYFVVFSSQGLGRPHDTRIKPQGILRTRHGDSFAA